MLRNNCVIIVVIFFLSLKIGILSNENNFFIQSIISEKLSEKKYQLKEDKQFKTVNIGLLISEPASENNMAQAAKHGAELAVKQANNSRIDNNQLSFELIVRSCEGPWGMGSKAAVELVFEDEVSAILTSLDGRNAHLAEQVIAKTKVAMISTHATDPTLTQAFIPWYFRCIPNDIQQADALVNKIIYNRELKDVIVISDNGYDGKLASDTFIKLLKQKSDKKSIQLFYDRLKPDFKILLDQIQKADIRNIILFGSSESSLKLIQFFNERNIKLIVFGSLSVIPENELLNEAFKVYDNVVLISSEHWSSLKGLKFQKEFHEEYGYLPGHVAAYAYDGANIIIEAIQKAGPYREEIIDRIKETRYEGVTRLIQFDEKGNRKANIRFMKIRDGKVLIEN